MAKTVNTAFNEFLNDSVNLSSNINDSGRSSRNWLFDQINNFPDKDETFPKLYKELNRGFGSFSRKTKIKPLDDIDILVGIHGENATYSEINDTILVHSETSSSKKLKDLSDENGDINSIKVLNLFKKLLNEIPQYKSADIKRNKEAVTLNLSSYDWTFDIVPCFLTAPCSDNRTYFVIPDGNGNWKKTDPRIDKERTQSINQKNNGKILNVIRIMKYWNKRQTMPSMPSYLLENIVINYYESNNSGNYIDLEIKNLLAYIHDNIIFEISDPQEIQGNINDLTVDEVNKIREKAAIDFEKAKNAIDLENEGDIEASMKKWGEIFGSEFPSYG